MTKISNTRGSTATDKIDNFAEWNPNPIIQLNSKGEIIYLNLTARGRFPTLMNLGLIHPVVFGLKEQVNSLMQVNGEFVIFYREIQFLNFIYEQQIFSVAERDTIFIYMTDITSQKNAEKQLKQKNIELTEATEFLNNILDSSIEYSIIASDLEGTILTWNAGAQYIYGYSAEEVIKKANIRVLSTADDVQSGRFQEFIDTVSKNGRAEKQFTRVRKDNEHFTASVVMSIRRDITGQAIGYLLISKDITEQQILEAQLKYNQELEKQNKLAQERNQLKNEFLANLSHELRTPLNAIIGFSELLHEENLGSLNDEQKDALSDILNSGKHLLHIISDLLDMTSIEFSRLNFRPEQADLKELTDEIISNFSSEITEKQINLTFQKDKGVNTAYLDPSRFKQVVYNYLSNALKFTPAGGRVQIRLSQEAEKMFRLEVEDNGPVIKAEDLKELFIEFQQLDSSAAKKYAGIGLGLSITKHIVEAQGGTVGALSNADKGNIFYATLPLQYVPK